MFIQVMPEKEAANCPYHPFDLTNGHVLDRAQQKLDQAIANSSELRGEALFNGKARCNYCHSAPYYTDNSMNNLKAERFYKQELANGMMMAHDGPIKTFPLRGIKDSPPYMHDGRCFTLEDTVEYFNLIQQLHLNTQEKGDLVAFIRTL